LGKGVLENAGTVRAKEAEKKANKEYAIYKKEQDKNYISDFDRVAIKYLRANNKNRLKT